MTKQLYEEALADVKRLTAVAEDNAKRAILEAVTPRIKTLIERELLGTDGENEVLFDDEQLGSGETTVPDSPVPIAPRADSTAGSADAITLPDEEGKVTLDLDALACEPDVTAVEPVVQVQPDEPVVASTEYILGMEGLRSLENVIDSHKKFNVAFKGLSETIQNLKAVSPKLRRTSGYSKQIARTISRVENMYDYVQERVTNPAKKQIIEQRLEGLFQDLTKLQELKMSKKLTDLIKEDDSQLDLGGDEPAADAGATDAPGELTLKLTGLPDDVDLDNVGVDLVADAGDDAGDEEIDLGGDVEGDDAEGGDDLGDLDLGGDDSGDQMEATQLSDDTIVEIDENMLRREILRMKKLREQSDAVPSNAGNGVDAAAMDDFGGGSDDGEPFLDGEVTTESEDVSEGDDVVEEMDEALPVAETQNRRKASDNGVSPNSDMQSVAYESAQRKLSFEKKIQERAKLRAKAIKEAAVKARGSKKEQLKKQYAQVARQHNESVARAKKINEGIESSIVSRSNSGTKQPAESKADISLRKQLAEQNLFNVKLVYANKVLQNESLTKRQKAQVIGKLDDARSAREAKLVYESVVKALSSTTNKTLKEGRDARVMGSSSRVTQRGSSQTLNEGFETDRWATLAGITKKA